MRDYKTTSYEESKPDIPMVIIATIFVVLVVDIAWHVVFNYFGF